MFSFLLFPHRGCQNVCQRTCWKSQYCHLHADADLTTAFRKGKCVNMDCCCCFLVAQLCLTLLWPCGLQPTRLNHPWNFPGKNTGMGCHFLLQGIFPTQGLNPCLLCWQAYSLPLSHHKSPTHFFRYTFFFFNVKHSLNCTIETGFVLPKEYLSYNKEI